MEKYSDEFKLHVVKEYLKGKIGFKLLAKNIQFHLRERLKHGYLSTKAMGKKG